MLFTSVLTLAALASTSIAAPYAAPIPTWGDDQVKQAKGIASAVRPQLDSCVTEQFNHWLTDNSWDETCNIDDFFCYCSAAQTKSRNNFFQSYVKYNCYPNAEVMASTQTFVDTFCNNLNAAKPHWNWG